jgi:hypothetical protein
MLRIVAASEEKIDTVAVVRENRETMLLKPEPDSPRILQTCVQLEPAENDNWTYVKVTTQNGNMAWSSPIWGKQTALKTTRS